MLTISQLSYKLYIIGVLNVLIFLFANFNACGQTADSASATSYFAGARFQYGDVLFKSQQLSEITHYKPFSFQLDVSLLKNSQQVWEYANCYIKNGISLSYTELGNSKVLGNAVSAVIFTEPYIGLTNRFQLTLRAGTGLSYLNEIYDGEHNPTNIYYSRHISFPLILNPNIYFSLGTHFRALAGLQFTHISNGGTQWPNWGINFLTGSLGLEYVIRPQRLVKRAHVPLANRKLKLIIHTFAGTHASDPKNNSPSVKKPVAGINIGVVKPLNKINAIGIGGEYYYDAVSKVVEAQSGVATNTSIASVNLQNYFFLGKVIFGQQLCYFITSDHPRPDSHFYQRYFLEYKLTDTWSAGFSLRAHGAVSDYLTLSVGFTL